MITADYNTEVALGNVSGYSIDTTFGRNPKIDGNSTPEDVWNGGGSYTGFNAISGENLQVFSSNANDTGTVILSGTVTESSYTDIIDSGATFISSGVVAGDIIVNDTQGIWGSVLSVVSETDLTVTDMQDGATGEYENNINNTYRVVRATGTGAGLLEITNILDSDWNKVVPKFVVLKGTTPVITTGNFFRCNKAKVITAGSNKAALGNITGRQATTTANVFFFMPLGFNSTLVGVGSVPAGKTMLIKGINIGISRSGGLPGSATISLRVRPRGSVFDAVRVYEISTEGFLVEDIKGVIPLKQKTDVKSTVDSVSDNNTKAQCDYEYLFIDNNT